MMKYINLAICLLMMTFLSSANTNVGKVLFAVGDVQVSRQANGESLQSITKGEDVLVGDVLITGDKSRLQVLFNDNARVSLRPNSQLRIDDYFYDKQQPSTNATATQAGKSAFSLLKGGFRTITGAVTAGPDKSGYKVTTAVATIGIRGTDYSVLFCNDDCSPLVGSSQNDVENGLYAGVSDGAIVLMNNAGELQLNQKESGFVESIDTLPRKLLGPPRTLFGQTMPIKRIEESLFAQNRFESVLIEEQLRPIKIPEVNEGEETEQTDLEERPIVKKVTDEEGNEIIIDDGNLVVDKKNVYGLYALQDSASFILSEPDKIAFDSNGNLIAYQAGNDAYQLGSAENLNLGFDPQSGFRWGRWSNGNALLNGDSLDLNSQSLHWLSNDLIASSEVALLQSGSASYALIGNTDPTNNFGDKGIVGSAEFSSNFTEQTVFSSISLGINGNNWQASGSGSIANGINQFGGIYSSVTINGIAEGSGQFSGLFSPNYHSNGLPVGAGLSYALANGNATERVNGVLVFTQRSQD